MLYLFPKEYANRIADRQFQAALKKKIWTAWRSLSEERWKEKVAKACQLRAEDVCVQLTNDYEAKIAEVKWGFFFHSSTPSLNASLPLSQQAWKNWWLSSREELSYTGKDIRRSRISPVDGCLIWCFFPSLWCKMLLICAHRWSKWDPYWNRFLKNYLLTNRDYSFFLRVHR